MMLPEQSMADVMHRISDFEPVLVDDDDPDDDDDD